MNLSERAMLVSLHIRVWQARKLDKDITAQVARDHGASRDVGNYWKRLTRHQLYADVVNAMASGRKIHETLTLPWLDEGTRILPCKMFLEYTDRMRIAHEKYVEAKQALINGLSEIREAARLELNGMFNAADFPNDAVISSKFAWVQRTLPLPSAPDFRVDLDDDVVANIKRDIDESIHAAARDGIRDLYERLADVLGRMNEKLREPDAIYRDSLFQNVREIVDMLPAMNFSGDAALDDTAREIRERILQAYSPDDCRENPAARQGAAAEVDRILGAIGGMLS